MERLALLRGDDLQDDHLLETDTMRFVAIMGMVFWIIFALIKSIPFQEPEAESRLSRPQIEKDSTRVTHQSQAVLQSANDEDRGSGGKSEKPASLRLETVPSQAASDTKKIKPRPSKLAGIQMQFYSLDDLLELMSSEKIQLFGRAHATGFDLFFVGYPKGNTVDFKGVNSLPSKLWEIKSGKDHAYFLALLAESYPAIRAFPTRQVLVSFNDEELEKRLEEKLTRLREEEKNVILSITRSGNVIFEDFDPEQDVSTVEQE